MNAFIRAAIARAAVIAAILCSATTAFAASAYQTGANGPSTKTVQDQVTQQSATLTAGIIADRISQATANFGGGALPLSSLAPRALGKQLVAAPDSAGKAAGSEPRLSGVWLNFAGASVRDTQVGANYDGPIYDAVGGIDHLFGDRLLVGLSAGFEHVDINTGFNNGTLKGDGVALAPYAAYIFNKNFSADAQIGHTWVRYNETHAGVSGHTDGDRWFGSGNFVARTAVSNWQLGSSIGYFYVTETQGGFIESNGNSVFKSTAYLGQLRAKESVGYAIPTGWGFVNPYGSARLEYDVNKSGAPVINSLGQTATTGDFGTTFALGVNAGIGDYTLLNLEGTSTQFRKNFDAYGLSLTLRVKF